MIIMVNVTGEHKRFNLITTVTRDDINLELFGSQLEGWFK